MHGVTASPQASIAVQRHGHSFGRRISAADMAIGTHVFGAYQTRMQVLLRSRVLFSCTQPTHVVGLVVYLFDSSSLQF